MRASSEAQPRPADAIEVDFVALARLAAGIQALSDELSVNGSLCCQLNDPDLAEVLHRVEHSWRKQQVTLQTFLDRTAQSVTASRASYCDREAEVAAAAGSGR